MLMKLYKQYLIYRLYIGIAFLVLSLILAFIGNNWGWFSLTLTIALISILSHFLFGPLRLVQDAVEKQDMVLAQKYLDMVKFPKLLIKPVRQGYYMIKSNIAMSNKDFSKAEDFIKQSINSKNKIAGKEYEGMSYMQLGMLNMQKGNSKEAKKNLRLALKHGLPDNDSTATTLLQLSSIEIAARQFQIGKKYFREAKALKPKNPEIVTQLKEMEKYISRVR